MIKAKRVSKSYPLYESSGQKLMALFGRKKNKGPLHHALEDINIEIARGEKVAVIGRNGAGKSTLLKLVTQAIEPTAGEIFVGGKTHALLQLGVGFHPEFSGRENAYSFLAYMGKTGQEADLLVNEAVDFAEIEEYIDQPLKTYSSGMSARLMFAVSTVINPELLVIDEVLGVGDAYFQNKSFERIREMCDKQGTTLLLVSHDVYSAAKLCERMIWIEKGRIYADGGPMDILKMYENSIRMQEDVRQKQKLALAYRAAVKDAHVAPCFLELRSRNNEPAASPVHFSEASIVADGKLLMELPLLAESLQRTDDVFVQQLPHTAWGNVSDVQGRQARAWNNYGTVEHKVGYAIFASQGKIDQLFHSQLLLTYTTNDVVDADVVFIDQTGGEHILGRLETTPGVWESSNMGFAQSTLGTPQVSSLQEEVERQGSGRMMATTFRMLDASGTDCFEIEHGSKASIQIDYRINDHALRERCQIALAFKRNGVDDVYRLRCTELLFNAKESCVGAIEVDLSPLQLGVGRYVVTTLIAKEGYYENSDGRFFSINPDVYDCQSVCLEFEVRDESSLFSHGTGYVGTAGWRHVLPQEKP